MDVQKMKTLIKQIRGVSYKPDDLHDTLGENSIILLRANNIDDGQINFDDVVYVDRSKVSKEQILRRGDILICASSGSKNLVGKAASVDFEQEATFGAFCKVVRPNCLDDAEYIAMYFQSPIYRREISAVAIGININNIRNEHIDSLSMNWPNSANRHQAVDVLAKIDSIIRHREAELRKLDDLIKARFVEMFGDPKVNPRRYPVKIIGSLVTDIIPGWSANGESRQKLEGEKAVLKVSAVTQGYFKPEEHKALPVNTEIKKYVYPHKGDLLFSRANTRELVGATAIIEEDYPDLILPDKLWRVLLSDELNVYYAKHVLSSVSVRAVFSAQSTGTSGSMFNVSAEKFKNIVIPIPPIELQESFESFIHQVDKSKVVIQKALDEAQVMFDSLMQQYFG